MEKIENLGMKQKQAISLVLGVLLAVFIWWFGGSSLLTDLSDYIMGRLDQMRNTVLALTAASSLSSTALTLLPGDIATPLAENLADISDYLLVVVAGIWIQKYMFSSLGVLALRILIPTGILVGLVPTLADLLGFELSWEKKWHSLGLKLALLGSVVFLVVPTTIYLTQTLESTYQATLDKTLESAESLDLSLTEENQATTSEPVEQENQNILGQIGEAVSGVVDGVVQFTTDTASNIGSTVTDLPQKMIGLLNQMIESLVILIVVNCLAPLAVFFVLMWLVKVIFGKDFSNISVFKARPMGSFVRKRTRKIETKEFEGLE